jgi:N-acetylglutamate synthase-like GNAT family acetyltransferase
MQIRGFHNEDSGPLANLFFQTVRRINIRDYTQAQVQAWAPDDRDMEKWRKSFEGKAVFIAQDGEKIIGFGELEPTGHIDRFYIDADHIGKGVGKRIYEAIERAAVIQKIPRLFAEASITAKPFFLQMGFTIIREQTVTVRGIQMNNFVMEKQLAK